MSRKKRTALLIIIFLLTFINNSYCQKWGLSPDSSYIAFQIFAKKIYPIEDWEKIKTVSHKTNEENSISIGSYKEKKKYFIETSNGFNSLINDYTFLTHYSENSISSLFGTLLNIPTNTSINEIYFKYFYNINKGLDLNKFFLNNNLKSIIEVNTLDLKENSSGFLGFKTLMLYYFIFSHEMAHIINGDVEQKSKLLKKIKKTNKASKLDKIRQKLDLFEYKADLFAYNQFKTLVDTLNSKLSKESKIKDFWFPKCSSSCIEPLILLEEIENDYYKNIAFAPPSKRILNLIKHINKDSDCGLNIEDNYIFGKEFLSLVFSNPDNLNLLDSSKIAKNITPYNATFLKKDAKLFYEALSNDDFIHSINSHNKKLSSNIIYELYAKHHKISILDKANYFLKGNNNYKTNLDSAFHYFKLSADSLNKLDNFSVIKSTPEKFEYDFLFVKNRNQKLKHNEASSVFNSLPQFTQKEKLNFIVALFYFHLFKDIENTKKYLKNENGVSLTNLVLLYEEQMKNK
ncbi:hypothetical protein EXU85_17130 [Spirosoma sp. KCTC 42546]|uniref:hypothetical protein n=1 Tax=Spirosoma sp. KCTC 42546 TaxID=2520506 RepID=UPI001159547B|nr:hypothetical protein [Spirosoma sp. KCTC 42546]QDK80232.1 hypothetical protein EXU85_17130 [Spirosoma sp. KCTC 42546]